MALDFEAMKAEKNGLDVWPDLLRYVSECTPVADIPEADLQRMKSWGCKTSCGPLVLAVEAAKHLPSNNRSGAARLRLRIPTVGSVRVSVRCGRLAL